MTPMKPRYEYKFVRLGERSVLGVKHEAREQYQEHIHRYAQEGWRLVQIFVPPLTGTGVAPYIELVLEREASE